ncbi:MAG: ABC transporter ATP-binding protein [Burkholderiales bacterium]|nr:ABC transporter ATP-binding protein [Burkholderiales bacterium]
MTSALQLVGISKHFENNAVLHNLDWTVARGKVIGLLGRNGAGKTTLLECALGLRETDQGQAFVMGEASSKLSDTVRAKIAFVPQNSELFEWMTGREMLGYFKTMYPRWNADKVDNLIRKWNIDIDKKIAKLSGGQKQRLSIIRALAHDPEFLILDEPVASLDPLGRREFLNELINSVIEQQTTVIFSTHILSDLERIAMDVAFLRDGKIVLQGELDHILESTYKIEGGLTRLQDLLQSLPAQIAQISNAINTSNAPILLKMSTHQAQELREQHPHLTINSMNLEDLFIEVTQ